MPKFMDVIEKPKGMLYGLHFSTQGTSRKRGNKLKMITNGKLDMEDFPSVELRLSVNFVLPNLKVEFVPFGP